MALKGGKYIATFYYIEYSKMILHVLYTIHFYILIYL